MAILSFVSYRELEDIVQFQPKKTTCQQILKKQWNEEEKTKFIRFLKRNKGFKKDKEFFQHQANFIRTKNYFQCRKLLREMISEIQKNKKHQELQDQELLYCFGPMHPNFELIEKDGKLKMKRIKKQ